MAEEQFIYPTADAQAQEHFVAGRPLRDLLGEIARLYTEDDRPWVIGYSGGKDSTTCVQLIFTALSCLSPGQLSKPVYIVSSNTLVETPLVIDLIGSTLAEIEAGAQARDLPISVHQVVPKATDSFWVNLLGRGYPAPTKAFRWCTERMKIDPVSAFIKGKVAQFGEVVVILGSRSQESSTRAQVIAKHKIDGSLLSRHTSLSNAYVYMPIENWSADEVWEYLMSAPRPWGGSNRELLELYRGSNAGECPVVIDTSTPSCGNSRFGCWTCTVVTTDKAMESLVEQGEEWMRPLLDFRNLLAETTEPANKDQYRNYRRRTGKVTYARGDIQNDSDETKVRKHIPGPYWIKYRQRWLEELLRIEKALTESGHPIELITREELHHIRREWLNDPNEPDWEDTLPAIYHRVYGVDLDWVEHDSGVMSGKDAQLLDELGESYDIPPSLPQKLLELEIAMDGLSRRRGLMDRMDRLLNQDWEDLESIKTRHASREDGSRLEEELAALEAEMQALERGHA